MEEMSLLSPDVDDTLTKAMKLNLKYPILRINLINIVLRSDEHKAAYTIYFYAPLFYQEP